MVLAASELSDRLEELINRYQEHLKAGAALRADLSRKDGQIDELKKQNARLRQRIDELDRERHTLKRMKEERKLMRKELATAVERLEALEKELAHGR